MDILVKNGGQISIITFSKIYQFLSEMKTKPKYLPLFNFSLQSINFEALTKFINHTCELFSDLLSWTIQYERKPFNQLIKQNKKKGDHMKKIVPFLFQFALNASQTNPYLWNFKINAQKKFPLSEHFKISKLLRKTGFISNLYVYYDVWISPLVLFSIIQDQIYFMILKGGFDIINAQWSDQESNLLSNKTFQSFYKNLLVQKFLRYDRAVHIKNNKNRYSIKVLKYLNPVSYQFQQIPTAESEFCCQIKVKNRFTDPESSTKSFDNNKEDTTKKSQQLQSNDPAVGQKEIEIENRINRIKQKQKRNWCFTKSFEPLIRQRLSFKLQIQKCPSAKNDKFIRPEIWKQNHDSYLFLPYTNQQFQKLDDVGNVSEMIQKMKLRIVHEMKKGQEDLKKSQELSEQKQLIDFVILTFQHNNLSIELNAFSLKISTEECNLTLMSRFLEEFCSFSDRNITQITQQGLTYNLKLNYFVISPQELQYNFSQRLNKLFSSQLKFCPVSKTSNIVQVMNEKNSQKSRQFLLNQVGHLRLWDQFRVTKGKQHYQRQYKKTSSQKVADLALKKMTNFILRENFMKWWRKN